MYLAICRTIVITTISVSFILFSIVTAADYSTKVTISSVTETTRISGFAGSDTVLNASKSGHAMSGISIWERRDHPCFLKLWTEDVNDSSDVNSSDIKDRCGGSPTSSELRAIYSDEGLNERRVFVSGIRVCMNPKETRVKGIQLRGKKITDDGKIVPLPNEKDIAKQTDYLGYRIATLPVTNDDRNEPYSYRGNCTSANWKKWAECSHPISIAVGLIAHFEAGSKPRSLTGVALQCRQAGKNLQRAGN